MTRKWKDSRGFSLVEMLCATVILVLLGLLINTGLNLAVKSYRNITAQEELELLVSNLSSVLADDLRYAKKVNANSVSKELDRYHSERYNKPGQQYTSFSLKADGQLYANDYRVLPSGSYGNGAYILADDPAGDDPGFRITYADGLFTIHLRVQQAVGGLSVSKEFTVRCLNPETTT